MNVLQRAANHMQWLTILVLAVLRTRSLRRTLMFWATILMMGMTFTGAFLILDALSRSLILFAVYWGLVFLQVILLLLLAIYDMLSVGREFRTQSRQNAERLSAQDPSLGNPKRPSSREDARSRDSHS